MKPTTYINWDGLKDIPFFYCDTKEDAVPWREGLGKKSSSPHVCLHLGSRGQGR